MSSRGPALFFALSLALAPCLLGLADPTPHRYAHNPMVELREDADRGKVQAQVELGKHYYTGKDVAQSYDSAALWFGKAADAGDPVAQYYMGEIFRLGQGRAVDLETAMHYYARAAKQQNGNAAGRLAYIYAMGTGVPKDYAQAYKFAVIAAVNDNHRAQYRLGLALLNTGKEPDLVQGMRWLHDAATGGDARAMLELGRCARDGHGMAKDPVEAAKWFSLAVEHGDPDAAENLAPVESGLDAKQRQEEKERAVDWDHANPTPPSPSP